MTTEIAIQEAIKYYEQAAVHHQLAAELNYKASRVLRGVSTTGTTKKKKQVLSTEQIARLIAKRERNTKTIIR